MNPFSSSMHHLIEDLMARATFAVIQHQKIQNKMTNIKCFSIVAILFVLLSSVPGLKAGRILEEARVCALPFEMPSCEADACVEACYSYYRSQNGNGLCYGPTCYCFYTCPDRALAPVPVPVPPLAPAPTMA
ncbi:hypothetical protein Dimus_008687 [Dionaea muscipula]